MEIYFATTNNAKVISLKRDLGKYGIDVIHKKIELVEPRASEVGEIAASKMFQAFPVIQKPTIVIDAGFYIPALKGFPRAYVNFALETVGLEGLLKLTEEKSRVSMFKECLAYMAPGMKEPQYIMAYVDGSITEPRGEMQEHLWSDLALIFIPEKCKKTLAEMPYDEYLDWRKLWKEKHSLGFKLYQWLSSNNYLSNK
ncbi:hypothetical protein KY330_04130 [Candidatus Woesearchaeota archaeon]|nr:hypothetical protein [Candidatus Woesearchaeota archaeon]